MTVRKNPCSCSCCSCSCPPAPAPVLTPPVDTGSLFAAPAPAPVPISTAQLLCVILLGGRAIVCITHDRIVPSGFLPRGEGMKPATAEFCSLSSLSNKFLKKCATTTELFSLRATGWRLRAAAACNKRGDNVSERRWGCNER